MGLQPGLWLARTTAKDLQRGQKSTNSACFFECLKSAKEARKVVLDRFPGSRTPFKAQSATARNGLQLKVPAQNSQKCHFRGAGFRPSSHPPELKIYQFARRTELPQTVHFERQRVKRRSEADPSKSAILGFSRKCLKAILPRKQANQASRSLLRLK